jgi:hypothetical protein
LTRQLRKQHFRVAEAAEVAQAHWIQDAVEVIAFVLHHAGVKALDGTVDRPTLFVEPGVRVPVLCVLILALSPLPPFEDFGHRFFDCADC